MTRAARGRETDDASVKTNALNQREIRRRQNPKRRFIQPRRGRAKPSRRGVAPRRAKSPFRHDAVKCLGDRRFSCARTSRNFHRTVALSVAFDRSRETILNPCDEHATGLSQDIAARTAAKFAVRHQEKRFLRRDGRFADEIQKAATANFTCRAWQRVW
jgi:hypothetical protein